MENNNNTNDIMQGLPSALPSALSAAISSALPSAISAVRGSACEKGKGKAGI